MIKDKEVSLRYDTLLYKDMESDLKEAGRRKRKRPKTRKKRRVRKKVKSLAVYQIPDVL